MKNINPSKSTKIDKNLLEKSVGKHQIKNRVESDKSIQNNKQKINGKL